MKAYDFLIQCESGIASVTGSPESASRVGVSVCDIGAGLNAYGAILEALHGRHRTGRGSGIRVSLFDGMADWMTVPLLHLEHGGKAPARTGLSHAMIAPYGAYPVGDGGQMVIAIQNEREWARFCEHILGDAALTTDPRFAGHPARLANRPEMDALIVEAFARHDMDTLAEALRGAQSPSAASTRSRGFRRTRSSAAQPSRRPPARSRSWHPPPATATARGTTAPSAPSRRWARRARRYGGVWVRRGRTVARPTLTSGLGALPTNERAAQTGHPPSRLQAPTCSGHLLQPGRWCGVACPLWPSSVVLLGAVALEAPLALLAKPSAFYALKACGCSDVASLCVGYVWISDMRLFSVLSTVVKRNNYV